MARYWPRVTAAVALLGLIMITIVVIQLRTENASMSDKLPCQLLQEEIARVPAKDIYRSPTGHYVALVLSRRGSFGPVEIDRFAVYDTRTCVRHEGQSQNNWHTSGIEWSLLNGKEYYLEIVGTHATISCGVSPCKSLERWSPDGSQFLCYFNTQFSVPRECGGTW
jgi:hypothetical protein